MVCPRCKKEFHVLRALSRFDRGYVCDQCGNEEAFEQLYVSGIISETEYKQNCKRISEYYKGVYHK